MSTSIIQIWGDSGDPPNRTDRATSGKQDSPIPRERAEDVRKAEGGAHKATSLKKFNVGRRSDPSSPGSPETPEKEKWGKFKLPLGSKSRTKKMPTARLPGETDQAYKSRDIRERIQRSTAKSVKGITRVGRLLRENTLPSFPPENLDRSKWVSSTEEFNEINKTRDTRKEDYIQS